MLKLKSTTDSASLIKKLAEELLNQLKIEGKIEVEEKEDLFQVQVETADTGILIGYHGETLASLQLILSLMAYKKTGRWLKMVVDIGDWRQRREESLGQMAQAAAEKVIASGEPIVYPGLSSFERRSIHLALAEHPKVTTISEGEREERKLIIKLK